MFKMTLLALVTAVAGLASSAQAQVTQGVDLAAMQGWDIVLSPDAIASEQYAAEEFQLFFAQASGVKLPITTSVDRPNKHIFIGSSNALEQSNVGFTASDFGEEDLRIIIRDDNIAIVGGRPRGTLYGVYTFLEEYGGVRFLTADHIHVPAIGKRVVGPVDRSYHPTLAYRYSGYGENDAAPAFATRLRNNAITDAPELGGRTGLGLINHSFHRLIPGSWAEQPCMTDPAIFETVLAAVQKELTERPQAKNVSVAQHDQGNYCRCPNCTAINDREESPMGSLLLFVNAIADEVAKEHPDVMVGTLAYWYSRKPPKTVVPRPNVQIQLASDNANVLRPLNDPDDEWNSDFYENMEQWSKLANHLSVWNYDARFPTYSLPVPNIKFIDSNIKEFVAHGAMGVFVQGAHNSLGASFADLRNYMISRLLWDPTLSGDVLMNEFLTLHYGKAAPPIAHYIEFLHQHAAAAGTVENMMGTGESYKIDESVIRAGLDAFEEAMALAECDVVRARVEKASTTAYCAAFAEAAFWTWENRNTTVPDANAGIGWGRIDTPMPDRLAQSLPYARRYFQLCEKYGVTRWGETVSIEQASAFFKAGYGLEENEPW
jgi:hypothetical protein